LTADQPEEEIGEVTRPTAWALGNPIRFRIWELLREGPSTASRLAPLLGESRGSASYHLRILARAGAIEEIPGEGTARERWWRRPEPLVVARPGVDPEGRAIDARLLALFFAREDDIRQRFMTRPVSAEWQLNSFVGNWIVGLTPDEADELGLRLFAIVDELRRRPRPDVSDQALVSISVLPILD
jgi:DNA-binding transcriptional ArsR family regulator